MEGMDAVAQQVEDLANDVEINQERAKVGLPSKLDVTSMIFSGPSGTGKTTVAELIAPLYRSLGITTSDKPPVTKNPSDLYGSVMGETQEKVRRAFDEAKGGVLFIDEAYGLVTGKDDVYGKQALSVMASEMSKNPDTVVILAGYEKDIKETLAHNEGMLRRFGRVINFKSYTPEERFGILMNELEAGQYELESPDLMDDLEDAVLDTGGGNAGDVMNLVSAIRAAQKRRLVEEEPAEDRRTQLATITRADIAEGVADFRAAGTVAEPLRGTLVPTSRKKAS